MLKFKAQIRNVGTSYVITVPRQYVDNEMLKEGMEYVFVVGDE